VGVDGAEKYMNIRSANFFQDPSDESGLCTSFFWGAEHNVLITICAVVCTNSSQHSPNTPLQGHIVKRSANAAPAILLASARSNARPGVF
jgi:hypothetical protein